MDEYVSIIARTCYFVVRLLASIHRFLTNAAAATLASVYVLLRIVYCNLMLFGSTHDVTSCFQLMQNYSACVILLLPKSANLKSLHWLPVKVGSTYKIACLCYHYHSSTAPSYVTDMLHTLTTLPPAHTPCLFSIDLLTQMQHLVIARFSPFFCLELYFK